MAGTLTISTLSDGTNSTSSTNCIQGSAKAWVNFNGTGTVAIRASYNVSSITDNGTGDYTINFTNAFADANYSIVGSCKYSSATNYHHVTLGDISGGSNPTTTTCRLMTLANLTPQDCDYVTAAVFR